MTNNKLSYFFDYAVEDGYSNTQIITNGYFQVLVLYDEFFEQNEKGEISKEKFLEQREVGSKKNPDHLEKTIVSTNKS